MKKITSQIRRAINDYKLIEEGDKIAVGLSGGKDSLVLLTSLSLMQKWFPTKFDIIAITIDIFDGEYSFDSLQKYCDSLGVELHIERTQIAKIIFDERKESSPCSLCAKMRRGALCETAKKLGYNKVALGHHSDDLIETFFLSMIYEGRLSTFAPKSLMDRTKITVIRPMLYVSEKEILHASKDMPIFHNSCPANHKTQRENIKNILTNLSREIPISKERIFSAITHSERYNLFDKFKEINNDK